MYFTYNFIIQAFQQFSVAADSLIEAGVKEVKFGVMSHENDVKEVSFTHYPSIFVFSKGENKKNIEIHAEDDSFQMKEAILELIRNTNWVETPEKYRDLETDL